MLPGGQKGGRILYLSGESKRGVSFHVVWHCWIRPGYSIGDGAYSHKYRVLSA